MTVILYQEVILLNDRNSSDGDFVPRGYYYQTIRTSYDGDFVPRGDITKR